MSLFNELLGAVGGTNSTAAPAPETALQGVVNLLHHPQVGGLAGLAQMFQASGLGHLVNGWIGTGPNPGVSPAQLVQVLGPQRIADFASHLGIPHDQAANYLAQLLPHAVDQLTPDGTIPPTPAGPGAASMIFNMLKSRVLGA